MTLRPRLPQRPPSATDLAERDRFRELVRSSLPGVRAAAEAWRNGLAAFITLLGAAIVVKGPATTADMTTGWRAAVTLLVGGGLALAVVGLWHALAAQAGTRPLAVTLADIHRDHGSLDGFEVATAKRSARRLTLARRTVAVALALLFTGMALTWWAPTAQRGSVKVTHGQETTCGTLLSADGGRLRIAVKGQARPTVVALTAVRNMSVTLTCP
ncbi:hypothetical protein QFZ82_000659 [Streptomyces sp. V4I23]|uniref:hypothetical protein n=1 Tax=Streptomyces sp. V4I23 TaxID=3042282 RepID=UPI002783EE6A|nr:hypothetical protein [Streptomyces sp. V4I23]MDQ1006174.1 hypothetical protein [Streptomyces sp. V4I23]